MNAALRALLWAITAGVLFVALNTLMRMLTLQLSPFETQFLRYAASVLVMAPFVLRRGIASYRPKNIPGQFGRGAVHTCALVLWFLAIGHISLADATAIAFTTPLFIMLGAALVLREPMRKARWIAMALGLAGVGVVVGPKLTGTGGIYTLMMVATCPIFAASFLFTKALTRYEKPEVIVLWQAITVTIFSIPLAATQWVWPGPMHWAAFLLCGILGSVGHYCLTRSYSMADISATQSVKFLELVWAAFFGWLAFGDAPSRSTLAGGFVICASTLWIAHRETRVRGLA